MYKIGTIQTINNDYKVKGVDRDEELNFSTINVELESEKGKFIYYIHFDFILEPDTNIPELTEQHLNNLKL